MKPTKKAIRQELKAGPGRVFKRSWDEVADRIQGEISLCGRDVLPVITTLLWTQGFEVEEAKEAALRLVGAADGGRTEIDVVIICDYEPGEDERLQHAEAINRVRVETCMAANQWAEACFPGDSVFRVLSQVKQE